jgi:hypothetical protein
MTYELGIDPMEETNAGERVGGDATTSPSIPPPSGAFYGRTQSRPSSPFLGRRPPSSSSASSPPPTYSHPHLQQQRNAFVNSIPWNKFAADYENAYNDAQADWITSRLNLYNVNTLEGCERREQMVSQICGGARILWRRSRRHRKEDGDDVGDKSDDADAVNSVDSADDDIPEGLDVIAQLVAIRRLSLLLYDNFDHLQMERMGRMWERLVIVFTLCCSRNILPLMIHRHFEAQILL